MFYSLRINGGGAGLARDLAATLPPILRQFEYQTSLNRAGHHSKY